MAVGLRDLPEATESGLQTSSSAHFPEAAADALPTLFCSCGWCDAAIDLRFFFVGAARGL
jgi:hypothetical protein